MGKVDGHATFVHLYLNGLYWGLYNPVERPEAEFAAQYFGEDSGDYDALRWRPVKPVLIDGSLERFNDFLEKVKSDSLFDQPIHDIERYVDLDSLIDHRLLTLYTGLGEREFRAVGRNDGDPRFRFFVWDVEGVMAEAGAHSEYLHLTGLRSFDSARGRPGHQR